MSEFLSGAGVVLAAAAAAAPILLSPSRARAATMLVALVLAPTLILGDQWHSPQIVDLRDEPLGLAGIAAAALVVAALLAGAFRRWPLAFPLAVVFALPFRVPLESGGDTANLLVPLYLVIAGGVLASVARDWGLRPAGPVAAGDPPPLPVAKASSGAVPPTAPPAGGTSGAAAPSAGAGPPPATGPVGWLPLVLAGVVVLYAVQALYSPDFSKSLQNVCFFFVPFAVLYVLLREVEWTRKALVAVLWVVALEATAFVLVGSIEYATRSLFWNDQVIRSNEFHTYFRVNSVFWDPNIYGRYLALAATIAIAVLLWTRERRALAPLTALVVVLWLGLVPTFSQSSFVALLGGLAVLAALRWSMRWAFRAAAIGAVLAVLVVLLAGGASKITFSGINVDTSGRARLITGGLELFADRPLWGYGSGSFPTTYKEHVADEDAPVTVSHTEPITVMAEQGLLGLASYLALLVTALWVMSSRLFAPRAGGAVGGTAPEEASATGRGGGSPAATGPARRPPASEAAGGGGFTVATGPARASTFVARAAILATFVALLVHTMAYAGFYEDPIAWVLLAMGASLAAAPRSAPPRRLAACRDTSAV